MKVAKRAAKLNFDFIFPSFVMILPTSYRRHGHHHRRRPPPPPPRDPPMLEDPRELLARAWLPLMPLPDAAERASIRGTRRIAGHTLIADAIAAAAAIRVHGARTCAAA